MGIMMIRFVQVLTLSLLAQLANATPQQLLTELQKMRLASTDVVTNFYMFTGLDADSKYDRRMQQAAKKFETSLKSATELSVANGVSDSLASIDADWKAFTKLLMSNRNDMLTQGFPNVRLVDEMGRTNIDIVQKVTMTYDQVQQTSGIQPSPIVQKSRSLALLMEEITSQYAARGTTNLGQVFMGNSERSLEQMADEFQLALNELHGMLRGKQVDGILKSIDSKWRFMAESVKNYNQNTVPFLVVSYNDRILMHLEELEERFQ